MHYVTQAIVVFLLLAVSALAAPEKDGFHIDWNSRKYTNTPFPVAWQPGEVPRTERNLVAFQKFKWDTCNIKVVVSRFGLPDRYLVKKHPLRTGEYNWLIYDLPDGYSVAFYVVSPPSEWFAAGVIVDPKGKVLLLIK